MKAVTIKQPWASLIIEGIKDIENRTWRTKFRGKILIHASAPKKFNVELTDPQAIQGMPFLIQSGIDGNIPFGSIIGYVEVIDCVINHSSIWAESTPDCVNGGCSKCTNFTGECPESGIPFNELAKPIYNWVLANPVKFDTPIPTKGKLSLWDFSICESCFKPVDDLRECERCETMIGDCCQAEYNQFTQIDYNCCKSCGINND